MKTKWMGIALAAALLPIGISAAQAADVITPFGDTTGTGPWNLTSTPSTYSGLEVDPSASFTFGSLTSLSASFTDIAGGAYGGAPRLSVGIDNGGPEAFIHIFLGTSPNYTDSNPAAFTLAFSGFNVIGNNDTGRYDTSQFAGGSPFTDYASALALLGSYHVDELDFVLDGGWGANGSQSLTLDSVSYEAAAVPEPAVWATMLLGFFGVGFMLRRTRNASAFASI